MAHEVNQSEKDVAAQVRSALVNRISSERLELWIPPDTTWDFQQGKLTLAFASDFACQLCRRMLRHEIASALVAATGIDNQEIFFVVRETKTMSGSAPQPTDLSDRSGQHHPQRSRSASAPGASTTAEPVSNSTCALSSQQVSTHDAESPLSMAAKALPVNPQQPIEEAGLFELDTDKRLTNSVTSIAKPSTITTTTLAAKSPDLLWSQVLPGESNQLAWTAVNLVLSEPGKMTPVLLHGPTGTGKSMMLASLVQRMRGELRMKRVVHMTSEQFTNDFTEGLQGGGLPMFRRKYRDVDALLLDDIQFLMGKRSTLAEVRHTIDILLRTSKQVVLAADRSLNELSGLGDELIGRLRGGLVTPIFPLDEQIRHKLLLQYTQQLSIQVDPDVLKQLAARVSGDGRLIRGLVNRLRAVAAMHPGKLQWDQCWNSLMDLVQATQPVVRLADIERAVCNMFGLASDSLQSTSKMRSVSQPRMLAMFLARKYTQAAYKEIGDYFGNRRHSTVISAEKTVEAWLTENANLEGSRKFSVRDAIRFVEAQLQVG